MSSEETQALHAISPLDGRYASRVRGGEFGLDSYFSEFALIRYRLRIEVEYFAALLRETRSSVAAQAIGAKLRDSFADYTDSDVERLRLLYKDDFDDEAAKRVKALERVTNHDVKAVEYYLKERMRALKLEHALEYVHFGLTSQDINNTAIPLMLVDMMENVYLPTLKVKVLAPLCELAHESLNVALLARTHGQPATPTTFGKEILVFVERIVNQVDQWEKGSLRLKAKFGGATGGLNAHVVALPQIDWPDFADRFVTTLSNGKLDRAQFTTQIAHYDDLAALFDMMRRVNTILLDFTRDMWQYVSLGYLRLKIVQSEVGSSAMPHKVNPIDFENAEGNVGLANSLFSHLADKLPVSRLQRDLSDSTVLRNIGVPLGHTIVAFHSVARGVSRVTVDRERIETDLRDNWIVVSEALQTILRRELYPEPYEKVKELTRTGEALTAAHVFEWVDSLDTALVSDSVRDELKRITPFNFTGQLPGTHVARLLERGGVDMHEPSPPPSTS